MRHKRGFDVFDRVRIAENLQEYGIARAPYFLNRYMISYAGETATITGFIHGEYAELDGLPFNWHFDLIERIEDDSTDTFDDIGWLLYSD